MPFMRTHISKPLLDRALAMPFGNGLVEPVEALPVCSGNSQTWTTACLGPVASFAKVFDAALGGTATKSMFTASAKPTQPTRAKQIAETKPWFSWSSASRPLQESLDQAEELLWSTVLWLMASLKFFVNTAPFLPPGWNPEGRLCFEGPATTRSLRSPRGQRNGR